MVLTTLLKSSETELKKVTSGEKDFDDAIEAAKHIKTIAKNRFLNLDDNS